MISVFYSERVVANAQSFSPSAGKAREVVASWKRQFSNLQFIEPMPATIDQLSFAHDPVYVRDVLALRGNNGFGNRMAEVAAALPYTSGAMIDAARTAIVNRQVAVAPVSGFHHACYAEGGGFCTFNGLIVAAQVIKRERLARRVGILDFDQHYGNGTVDILRRLDLAWIEHYSAAADWDDAQQAPAFLEQIPQLLQRFANCDLLLYQAGADPHIDDPLGGWLNDDQLRRRDRLVFAGCRNMKLPVAWNLAGGYQQPLRKVLDIHDATMAECVATYGGGELMS